MANITIYSTDYCPYCVQAKRLLASKKVSFEEINVENDPAKKAEMIERSGGRTVPQIFIDEKAIGGCDELYQLESAGELDKLLGTTEKVEAIHRKLIILGSGPAGYTAAVYAARANLSPLVISGPQKGGQLTTTTIVDNFPGFPEGVDGNELMYKMEAQAKRFDTEVIFAQISKVDLSVRPFKLYQDSKLYTCDALIIATGASARYMGLDSEKEYMNKGVSACATCDGFFYKKQKVAVIGGGDTALEEAHYLTNFCEKVFLVHRRDEFRASKAMQERILNNDKIEVVWDSVVEEVIGDGNLMTDLQVKNIKTGKSKTLGVVGMFVAIGHTPNTKIFNEKLNIDEEGYLKPIAGTMLNIDGVFACGDVMDNRYRQAITAAGTGAMAAIDAERWLAEQ